MFIIPIPKSSFILLMIENLELKKIFDLKTIRTNILLLNKRKSYSQNILAFF